MSSTTTPPNAPSTVAPKQRKGQILVMKLLLLAVSVVLCLVLLELAVRLLMPQYTPERQVAFHMTTNRVALGLPSQTVRQRTPKGDYDLAIRFNALGFRDPREPKEATGADWFVLGDSFSFGWGVPEEQRYSNLLEADFRTNGATRVFNIAVPENIIGYQQLLAYAERNGAKVGRLIVGICMENDLRDYTDGRTSSERDYLHIGVSTKRLTKHAIKTHSALYIALSYTLHRSPACRKFMEKVGIASSIDVQSGKNEWNPKVLESSRDELLKLVAGRDALILIIPARHLWHGDNMQTEDRVHEAFVRLVREAGLRVIDMRPLFEKTGRPLDHYFKTDPHWNAQGHAVAAAEVFRTIQALKDSGR